MIVFLLMDSKTVSTGSNPVIPAIFNKLVMPPGITHAYKHFSTSLGL